jgi:hypothetical protein
MTDRDRVARLSALQGAEQHATRGVRAQANSYLSSPRSTDRGIRKI